MTERLSSGYAWRQFLFCEGDIRQLLSWEGENLFKCWIGSGFGTKFVLLISILCKKMKVRVFFLLVIFCTLQISFASQAHQDSNPLPLELEVEADDLMLPQPQIAPPDTTELVRLSEQVNKDGHKTMTFLLISTHLVGWSIILASFAFLLEVFVIIAIPFLVAGGIFGILSFGHLVMGKINLGRLNRLLKSPDNIGVRNRFRSRTGEARSILNILTSIGVLVLVSAVWGIRRLL